jgi:hypothetical protein
MYIYKLDFPTGEFYIGKTATSLDTRLESNSHHMQRVYNKYKQLPSITV